MERIGNQFHSLSSSYFYETGSIPVCNPKLFKQSSGYEDYQYGQSAHISFYQDL